MMTAFRPSTPDDERQIVELLARTFSVEAEVPFLNPLLVRWKYWGTCEQWPEPRSWVAERDGRIVAHACLWPVTLKTGERGATMIDWVSDPRFSGAGVALWRHLRKLHAFLYSVGGSDIARAIVPRLRGVKIVGEALTWARPLRPVHFVRNIWPALMPPRTVPRGFRAEILDDAPHPSCERDLSFVQFLKKCPVSRCFAFHILKERRKVGWFALTAGRVQARIAGIWLENRSTESWRIAFNLAQRAALGHTGALEIVARCWTGESCLGAQQAGMKVYKRRPIHFASNAGVCLPPVDCQMCDDDSVFLNIDQPELLTGSG